MKKISVFLDKLSSLVIDVLTSLGHIIAKKNVSRYCIDLNITKYSLLPFNLHKITYKEFKDSLIYCASLDDKSYTNYIYIFDYKGNLIYHSSFIANRLCLTYLRDDNIVSMWVSMMDACVNNVPSYYYFFNNLRFFMYVTDKNILKSILNKNIT